MNTEALFLLLILILGLLLCSFLGGNCDKEGFNSNSSTQLQAGTTFIDPKGNTITVTNNNGGLGLQMTQVGQSTPILFTTTPPTGTTVTANTFYATPPLKMTATVITDSNGQAAIQVTLANGQTDIFTQSGSSSTSGSITSTQYYGSTGSPYQTGASNTSYTGAYGGSAGSVTGPNGNTAYYAQGPNGNTSTSYNPYYNGTSSTQYYGPYGGSAGSATGPNGNTYSNSLPPGIPASQIPAGQEDLYILKSQVVPPVCPVCPACTSGNNDPDAEAKCPACPACARCPEPSFECKKVPNYNAINNSYLPQPIVNDFSSFGM